VGKKIGVTVSGSVGEGSEDAVHVGVIAGVGVIRLNPPHPISDRASIDIPIKNFLVIASWQRFVFAPLTTPALAGGARVVPVLTGSAEGHFKADDSNPTESADPRA